MSLTFLIAFLLLTAALYYLVPLRIRPLLLLVLSYAFYAYCGLSALPYLLLTTLSVYLGARRLGSLSDAQRALLKAKKAELSAEEKKRIKDGFRRRRRLLFWAVLLLNFGLLCTFKYTQDLLNLCFGLASAVTSTSAVPPALNLLLPLGISFYTFQSVGYLIDVYNGKYPPEKNLLHFALFVSFFPQLIQGPIGRGDQLLPQLVTPHRFDPDAIRRGALLMLWGFFKKKIIADRAYPLVETVFSGHEAYGGAVIVIGVLFYSLQQYADFSGGIDLVTGAAQMMGIHLAPNFRRPYFAVSLGDFWRRWHISLGSWMRDYVFYPFALTRPVSALSKRVKGVWGANAARTLPAALGNLLVFFIVGVWHGATGNYVAWGLYNGLILAVSALMEPAYKRFHERRPALRHTRRYTLFTILRTFLIVNIGWYFDRSLHASDALSMLWATLTRPLFAQLHDGTLLTLGLSGQDFTVLLLCTLLLFAVSLMQERGVAVRDRLFSLALPLRWLLLIVFIVFILATLGTSGGANGFMYAVF